MATAKELIEIAKNEVGYCEKETNKNLYDKTANAGDKNYTKYAYEIDKNFPTFYNGKKNGFEWCDIFVDWCFIKAFGVEKALELLGQPKKSSGAGCYYSAKYYKKINRFYTEPKIGDQIFFKNVGGGVVHTGIVYNIDDEYVYTIEGNTSAASGVVANGGCVATKQYQRSYNRIYGYGRPKYDTESIINHNATVLEWQKAADADGYKFPKYGTDGHWGAECESVAKKAICKRNYWPWKNKNLTKIIQKTVGVTADGKFGGDTKKAVIAYQKKKGLAADGVVGLNTWKKILNV